MSSYAFAQRDLFRYAKDSSCYVCHSSRTNKVKIGIRYKGESKEDAFLIIFKINNKDTILNGKNYNEISSSILRSKLYLREFQSNIYTWDLENKEDKLFLDFSSMNQLEPYIKSYKTEFRDSLFTEKSNFKILKFRLTDMVMRQSAGSILCEIWMSKDYGFTVIKFCEDTGGYIYCYSPSIPREIKELTTGKK